MIDFKSRGLRDIDYDSVEITNKMQPCDRIYYSNVY